MFCLFFFCLFLCGCRVKWSLLEKWTVQTKVHRENGKNLAKVSYQSKTSFLALSVEKQNNMLLNNFYNFFFMNVHFI